MNVRIYLIAYAIVLIVDRRLESEKGAGSPCHPGF